MPYSPFRRANSSPKGTFALDLHGLATPPAFVLSQDQTLHLKFILTRRDTELQSSNLHGGHRPDRPKPIETRLPAPRPASRVQFKKRGFWRAGPLPRPDAVLPPPQLTDGKAKLKILRLPVGSHHADSEPVLRAIGRTEMVAPARREP